MTEGQRWRRSASVWPENAYTAREDDWTLVGEDGRRLARLVNRGIDDDEGIRRWWVYRPNGNVYGGSAATGAGAREICEGLTGENHS